MVVSREWRRAAGHGAFLALLILAPLAYWFGWANRYIVFLYEHAGAGPFDPITTGRYLMASLVASGGATVVYAAGCWAWGRLAARPGLGWAPPVWWRVWLWAALPVGAGVAAIAMTLGSPTLPPPLALACAFAALVGLAGAAVPGAPAARAPVGLVWLAADAATLAVPLLLLRTVAPEMQRLLGRTVALAVAGGSVLLALGGSAIIGWLRRLRGRPNPSAMALYAGGLIEAYLLLPVLHYLLSDPGGPYYITATENVFPHSVPLQVGVLAAVGGLAWCLACLRRRWARPRASGEG